MELFSNLLLGFSTALSFENILYCFTGVFVGTAVGVLPGIGPLAAITMLLPLTYSFSDPSSAIIMLAGIYYGCQYGGSTSAILANIPGESSAVVTVVDGYQMTKRGRAGTALVTAALSSFFAGTVATMFIAIGAPVLAEVAFAFGPPDYFSLMLLGLLLAVALSTGSFFKSLAMVIFGVLLGLIGTDVTTGVTRFDLSLPELFDGIPFVVIAMGLFGFAEIMYNLENPQQRLSLSNQKPKLSLTSDEFKRAAPATAKGTVVGSLLGLLPGSGGIIASFAAYAFEKRTNKKHHKEFGHGAIEGVASPEAANNAGSQTSFIPMLVLGIPTTPIMALMIAALLIHNVVPGPQIVSSNPEVFWGLIASMWIGNLLLLVLNLPLIGIWVRLLNINYNVLYPLILVFACLGVYVVTSNIIHVLLTIPFAVLGYLFKKWECEPAPLMMGFIVGAAMEEHLRRALTISRGDWMIFIERPISASLLAIAVASLIAVILFSVKNHVHIRETRNKSA